MYNEEYEFIRKYLKNLSGIELGDDRQFLVETRLSPLLQQFGCKTLSDLVITLRGGPSEDLKNQLISALTTNESLFFRDKVPFEALRAKILPQLMRSRPSKRLSIWSAACSTGQEPYSIAMTLLDAFPELQNWDIRIQATDISPKVIEIAKKGVFSDFEVQRGLDEGFLKRFFRRLDNTWQVDERIKNMVQFGIHNLVSTPYTLGPFDIVFCRNVLIYFDPPTKTRVLNGIANTLLSDGYLVLGGSEMVHGLSERYEKLGGWSHVFVPRGAR